MLQNITKHAINYNIYISIYIYLKKKSSNVCKLTKKK